MLAAQLTDEPDLAYGLDLFDAIDRCRKIRDVFYSEGNVLGFRHYEKLRNEHITVLAALLESKGNK